MRLPTRKKELEKYALQSSGPVYLTDIGAKKLDQKIEQLQKEVPELRAELTRTREMGDLSENAAYQIAKHKLRRTQNAILGLQEKKKRVVVIAPDSTDAVQLGSHVTYVFDAQEMHIHLVGPDEVSIQNGRISYLSPIGQLLIGKKVNDTVTLPNGKTAIITQIA